MPIPATRDNINAFLHFGWLPRPDVDPPFPLDWIPLEKATDAERTDIGADILRKAVSESIGESKTVVVPLSGGLDSRAILAAARDTGVQIVAATVGSPHTLDFEIGALVAKRLGVEHVPIDVDTVTINTAELVEKARAIQDWTNITEVSFHLLIAQKYPNTPILTGLLGDWLAGSYAHMEPASWEEAKRRFVLENQRVSDRVLTIDSFRAEAMLPDKALAPGLKAYEELVLRARHSCSFRPTVFANRFNCLLPFRNRLWVEYMLGLPHGERLNQRHYKQLLAKHWPRAFSLPCKNNSGLPLQVNKLRKTAHKLRLSCEKRLGRSAPRLYRMLFGRAYVNPFTNYREYHLAIHRNARLRAFYHENLVDLANRGVLHWLDFGHLRSALAENRLLTQEDATATVVLTDLEINLKAT